MPKFLDKPMWHESQGKLAFGRPHFTFDSAQEERLYLSDYPDFCTIYVEAPSYSEDPNWRIQINTTNYLTLAPYVNAGSMHFEIQKTNASSGGYSFTQYNFIGVRLMGKSYNSSSLSATTHYLLSSNGYSFSIIARDDGSSYRLEDGVQIASLNGNYCAISRSVYAPTSYGSSGQLLVASGNSNTSPTFQTPNYLTTIFCNMKATMGGWTAPITFSCSLFLSKEDIVTSFSSINSLMNMLGKNGTSLVYPATGKYDGPSVTTPYLIIGIGYTAMGIEIWCINFSRSASTIVKQTIGSADVTSLEGTAMGAAPVGNYTVQ